jgi:hypothetical protein
MLGRYFERGSSPPPPPPPPKDGDGLRLFNPCSPCCDGIGSSDYFCTDFDYAGDLAIVNGSGIYPLIYSGLNELGFKSWVGIVSFPNGFAGTARSWIPTGEEFSLDGQGISNTSFDHDFISHGNTSIYPDICSTDSIFHGSVFVNDNNWRGSLGNLKPACNSFDLATACGNTSRTFKLCSYHDYQEKTVVFPDVKYEYYVDNDGYWWVRFKYLNQENFNFPRPLKNWDTSGNFFLNKGSKGDIPCHFTGLLRYRHLPLSLIAPSGTPYAEDISSIKSNEIQPYTDEIFWSWTQPVYSNDKFNDPEITNFAVSDSGSEAIITSSYSTVYAITILGGWFPLQLNGNITLTQRIFVGVTENTPNMENLYDLEYGLLAYYDSSFDPKFSKTLTHPFFPSNYIEDSLALYEGSNSRSGYYQISEMSANGFFRATVPYPLKRTLNPGFIANRTKKISPYLNCQISMGEETKNFQMTNVSGSYDPYKAIGVCYYYDILQMLFGLNRPQCLIDGTYHLYIGQPDKYSCGVLILDETGKKTSFVYYKIITNGKLYNKVGCGFFQNLENVFNTQCLDAICTNNISCCVNYSTWNSVKCDQRLNNDFTENLLDQKHKIFSTGFFDIKDTNLLNDDPMILSFEAKCPIKVSKEISLKQNINGFILNCFGGPFTSNTYSFDCPELTSDNLTFEYELADVSITELT